MILKENFDFCPYIRAIQRESRRNAQIRDEDRRREETDIPEEKRMEAHMKRRIQRCTKSRWYRYAQEYTEEIARLGPAEKDNFRQYLQIAREKVDSMRLAEKQKQWHRDRKARIKIKQMV